MGAFFSAVKRAGAWNWPLNVHLVLRLRMNRAVPLLPLYAFMAWTGTTVPLYLAELSGWLSIEFTYAYGLCSDRVTWTVITVNFAASSVDTNIVDSPLMSYMLKGVFISGCLRPRVKFICSILFSVHPRTWAVRHINDTTTCNQVLYAVWRYFQNVY